METEDFVEEPITIVSFRISSLDLDPDNITQMLDLVPERAHSRGDRPKNAKHAAYKVGLWSMRSPLSKEQLLPAHLENLLTLLEPKHEQLLRLSEENVLNFYATLFSQIGFELSPQLMRRIANLNATLGVTVYSSDEFREDDAMATEVQ